MTECHAAPLRPHGASISGKTKQHQSYFSKMDAERGRFHERGLAEDFLADDRPVLCQ